MWLMIIPPVPDVNSCRSQRLIDSLLSVVLRVAAFETAVLPPNSAFRTDAKLRELNACHDLIFRTALEMLLLMGS